MAVLFDHPLARTDLIVESIDDGKVIYVADTCQAHYLDEVAAAVWDACDGARTPEDLARELGCDAATVDLTLSRLADTGLLAPPSPPAKERGEGLSRRGLLHRGAVAGAAMTVGVGTILSVKVPPALAAISHAQTVDLFVTPSTACTTVLEASIRGTVVASISNDPGFPALDKLQLVVTLSGYTTGLPTEIFDISINCGPTLGTITAGATGAGGPVTINTTVPTNQVSVVTVVPTTQPMGFTIYTKASTPFVA